MDGKKRFGVEVVKKKNKTQHEIENSLKMEVASTGFHFLIPGSCVSPAPGARLHD